MENKVITVTSPLLPSLDDFIPYLQDIWNRKWLTNNGHYHQELEKALCEYLKVPYIMMHMRGTPQTMQRHTDYPDMMEEIMLYFSRKVRQLRLLGVNDIILDPGFGFSKTLEQNYQLMSHLKEFSIFELPLLVGVSRKSMIYKLLGGTPADSLNGTTVLNTYALLNGANILRVHDVREAVEAIRVIGQMTNK